MKRSPRPLVSHHGGLGRYHHLVGSKHAFEADVLGEIADVFVLGPKHDVLGRSDLRNLTVVHDGDAVAELQRLVQVVGNEYDGLVEFVLEPQKLVLHLPADQGIQSTERLVHKKDVGVHGQSPGQSDPLLHTARQLAWIGLFPATQPHQVQHLFGTGVAFRLATP